MDRSKALLLSITLILFVGFSAGYNSSTGGGGPTCPDCGTSSITVDFSYSPSGPDPGESVSFTDESSSSEGSINSWDWEFGNGDFSTNTNPSTIYSDAGEYKVTLTVTDTAGNTGWKSKTIQVSDSSVTKTVNCWNGNDEDNDGLTDGDDAGCVEPNENDAVEGWIYDTDLTAVMEGFTTSSNKEQSNSLNPQTTESLKFKGTTDRVGDGSSGDDSGSLTEYYVDAARSESDKYAFGYPDQQSFSTSDFNTYNGQDVEFVDSGGRIVDPPHDLSEVCGNGLEEESYNGAEGDEKNDNPSSISCKADIGRILEKHYINSPYERDGMECEDDDVTCQVDTKECDTNSTDATCSCADCTTGSASADATCETSCTTNENNTDDESHTYYLTSGDTITTHSCEDDGGWIDSADCEITTSECSADASSCNYDYPSGSCDKSSECSGDSAEDSDSDSSKAGRYRDWKQVDSYNCYAKHSQTDGGGLTNSNRGDNDPAGTYTRFTAHSDDSWGGTNQDGGEDGTVWCGYDYTLTVNADGPQGNGDGFIVIDERSGGVVARESPDGSDSVGRNVHYGQDGDATNVDGNDYINLVDTSCSGDSRVCIKYVDYYTKSGGSEGNPTWEDVSSAVKAREIFEASPDESYSVCKAINRINEKNGDSRGNDLIDCDYERGGSNISPLPQACGDEDQEHLMMMEGPEVSQGVVEDYLFHEQKCVSWGSSEEGYYERTLDNNACILKGKPVSEGTVANVVSGEHEAKTVDGYERPQDSPDYEVCLNMRSDSGISTSYEDKEYNYRYNDPSQPESEVYGGQWYDLDDPRVNEYLRANEGSLGLSSTQRSGEPNFVDYYYTENPNPYHATYNPEGNRKGTSLLADCGPLLPGCAEDPNVRQGINNEGATYFAYFEEFNDGNRTRDEDYNPLGRNYWTDIQPYFNPAGTINYIKSRSDQLSPGHYDYDNVYDTAGWYRTTEVDADNAVQYTYTRYMTWSLAATGVPYPPYGASETGPYVADNLGNYYREDYSGPQRSSPGDDTVQKTAKAFANSLAVVAQKSGITDSKGDSIAVGEGYWINPDDIKDEWDSGNIQGVGGTSSWRDLLTFKTDLTGPDSGIGYDLEEGTMSSTNEGYVDELREGGSVVFADIYWQGMSDTGILNKFETPVCGDDRYEFLLEELGESQNSEKFDGKYACADSPDYCVSYEGDDGKLFSAGGGGSGFEYLNTNEPREDTGRLKQDKEVCAERSSDDSPMWYDQDYGKVNGELTCRENNLYGELGIRWLPYNYINQYPHAVTGGIDDSWSDRLYQMGHPYLDSDPDSFPDDPLDNGVSPVDTGTNATKVADPTTMQYGFCAGDDDSEYLIHQKSETRFIETDNNVLGAAESPRSCVLENSRLDNSDEERRLYEEGDRVTFQVGDGSQQEIACFNGAWWGDWPVVFLEDKVTASLGETRYSSFRVINPEDSSREFDLGLSFSDDKLDQLTTFASTNSNKMNVTVPGQESRTFDVEIKANRELTTEQVELQAESRRGDLEGFDQLDVEITETGGSVGNTQGQVRDVPGLTIIQLIVMGLIGSVIVFFRV